ncbi:hypothetical protein TL16_g11919 [Triparma laevis f. inornata]|uniref:START domain-containing protein n=1 Tax=Triparma laevis f. inornata TaxID=1714386 RepID=A0A9W7BQR5_9STRA|nr:hypothetical protein TL16_g11919 [Triparma laevis f. inornata]
MIAALHAELKAKAVEIAQLKAEKAELLTLSPQPKQNHSSSSSIPPTSPKTPTNPFSPLSPTSKLSSHTSHPSTFSTSSPHVRASRQKGSNTLSQNTITNNCIFNVSIHTPPLQFFSDLLGSQMSNSDSKSLYQEVLESHATSKIVYWSFTFSQKNQCDLLLRLTPSPQPNNTIEILVTSITEDDLEPCTVIPEPHVRIVGRRFRLRLNNGVMKVEDLEFGQSSFTFMAEVELLEVDIDETTFAPSISSKVASMIRKGVSFSNRMSGIKGQKSSKLFIRKSTSKLAQKESFSSRFGETTAKTLGFVSGDAEECQRLFCKIADMFYERFKKEDVIDQRMKEDFISNIPNAPPLTLDEQSLVAESMNIVDELANASRIAGTVNESVEKFLKVLEGESAGWGKTVAKMNTSAVTLFSSLWLIDTYKLKAETKQIAIREIWTNLDGTRSQQYTRSFSLPGFKDRIFEAWQTWDVTVDADGRQTFIIAISPLDKYKGTTRHKVAMDKSMVKATSRGVYVIKELTENTCEWTRAQQFDLNIAGVPLRVANIIAKEELKKANKTQEKFRRNGKEVDRETMNALARVMEEKKNEPLMQDQVAVFERCEEFFGDVNCSEGWKPIDTVAYPNSKMWMQYFASNKREMSMAFGRAVGIADGTAEELAAWQMDFCSDEKMRTNIREKNPARLELTHLKRVNEITFATVKKMPFPLDNREFIVRLVWKSEDGKVLIAFEPADIEEVDYGLRLRSIRARTRGIWQFENLQDRGGVKQCRVTLIQHFDIGGIIPKWIVDKKLPHSLSAVQEVIDEFRQDEKIDAAELKEQATFVRERGQDEVYSEEENALIQRTIEKFEVSLKDGGWSKLKSPDNLVKMEIVFEETNKKSTIGVGRAITVVDASAEECVAWEFNKMSRQSQRGHYEEGGLGKSEVKLNDHHSIYNAIFDYGLSAVGLSPREVLMKKIWKVLDEQTIIVTYESFEHPHYPVGTKNSIRATGAAFWRYEKLPEVDGIPQTRVAYSQQLDLKGLIPKAVVNTKAPQQLGFLSTMRKKFDRSTDMDSSRREKLVRIIAQKGLDDENTGVNALKKFEELYEEKEDGSVRSSRSYGLADSKVHAGLLTGGHAWGRTVVRFNAKMESVAAFFWDFGSNKNMQISGDVERIFEEDDDNVFKKVVKRRQYLESTHGGSHRDRLFTSEMSLCRVNSDNIIILISPVEGEGKGRKSNRATRRARGSVARGSFGSVEAKEIVAISLTRLPGGKSKVSYVAKIDFKFGISHGAVKHFVERRLEEITNASVYFQRLVRLEDYKVEDGQALAHDLLWTATSGKKRVDRLKEVAEQSRAMRDMTEKYPWFEKMLANAVEGSLNMNRVVEKKLVCVTEKEAEQIGKNLVPSLMTQQRADAGVHEWKMQNRAVKELMEAYEWFEPMAVILGKEVVKTAPWGLVGRVVTGAALRVADLGSDIIILKFYWEAGESMLSYRNSTLACLVASMGLSLFFVVLQYRKCRLARILKEVLITLVGMKAPWDAFKVSSGLEQEEGTEFDPMKEMQFSKCIEMFAESLPSINIQSTAILSSLETGGEISQAEYTSVFVSLLTVGYISASISYDADTDPQKRAEKPEFYGYVHDSARLRGPIFVTMSLMSSFQVLLKGLLVTTLGIINTNYVLIYILGDLFIYLGIKVSRGDFRTYIPIDGVFGLIVSFLLRVATKMIADFTGCIHFRHPYEVGGFVFSINYFVPLVGLILLLFVFKEENELGEKTQEYLENLTIIGGSCLCFTTFVFIRLINPDYISTFFSTETGGQMTRRIFLEGDDFLKSHCFPNKNKTFWMPIEEKVREWLKEGWERWEDEKPVWFTDKWRARVPAEMVLKMRKRWMERGKREEEEEEGEEGEEEEEGGTKSEAGNETSGTEGGLRKKEEVRGVGSEKIPLPT